MDYLVCPNKFNRRSGNARVLQRGRRYYNSSKRITGLSGASPGVWEVINDIALESKLILGQVMTGSAVE